MKTREIIDQMLEVKESYRRSYTDAARWSPQIKRDDEGDWDDTPEGEAQRMRDGHARQYGYGKFSPEALRVQATQQARPTSTGVKITAKYSGKCSMCPEPITVGMRVNFDPSTRKVSHISCK